MTAALPRVPVVPLPRSPVSPPPGPERADQTTQQHRRLRWTATLAGVRARASMVPAGSVRRRQSLQLCSAARLLTAVGIRVVVVQPPTPWPRDLPGRLVIGNEAGLLGELALLTAVPRTTQGWTAVADRVLPVGRPVPAPEQDPSHAVACPVTVAYRTAHGPLPVPPRTLNEVVAIRGLVIEVRLLAAGRDVPRAV
ncbi:hypothetical protein [Blastococcus mobilis]|uniref:Uncharacterized protein n=1 Tax=Blastococcus mobilis TaxID=1938746 RepID=A0A238WIL8_9ACTN|nr:hypothetical protein [Blastococcus mobilis]SNR46163.1 hypothetical protein SAMN06272737_10845 [Blastococcus mobilis]